jgi:hypothetical protein
MHPTVLKSARHCNKQVSAYAALPGDIYFDIYLIDNSTSVVVGV